MSFDLQAARKCKRSKAWIVLSKACDEIERLQKENAALAAKCSRLDDLCGKLADDLDLKEKENSELDEKKTLLKYRIEDAYLEIDRLLAEIEDKK